VPLGKEHVPSGELFDYSCNFTSLLIGVLSNEVYACFPMPFAKGAVIRLNNMHKEKAVTARVKLDVETRKEIPVNWGRFHATFSEERAHSQDSVGLGPKKVPSKIVLDRDGCGKYVGTLLHVEWPSEFWWGEGDWMIWSDEPKTSWPPSYHGTGSEEYFQGGGCQFDRKAVSGFVSGRPGHATVYSFHLNDAFQFRKNVRVAEEQMGYGPGDERIRSENPIWTTTAFWYADRPLAARSGLVLELQEKK
jgi:hypothetical protein